ncbi:MAG: hypothetical protein ABI650_01140 [Dokdonella sp.]
MTTYRPPRGALRPSEASPRDSAARRIGAIVWPSFFAAGVATMVFFAIVDPLDLAAITWPIVEISREAGYTIGFFMFWMCTFSACLFTALLIAPPLDDHEHDPAPPF